MFKDTVTATGQLNNTKIELPIETEMLIPDYQPEVFKIVKNFVYPVVLQKQLQAGRVVIEGYFRIEIFYQDENGLLCSAEQKLPFSRNLELKQGEWHNVCVDVFGEIQYINCRAVNQRRLDIRGAYTLNVKVTTDFEQELLTAVQGMGLQQKTKPVDMLKILSSQEKQFTLEENIEFVSEPRAVLHTGSNAKIEEIKLLGGKAVVKGEIIADVIYRTESGLENTQKALPFNQIVEIDGVDEDCSCNVNISPVGCAIMSADDEKDKYKISLTSVIQVKAIKSGQFIAVCDGFSTLYETELTMQDINTEILLDNLTNTVQTAAEGKLPDEEAKILYCTTTCFEPELATDNNGATTYIRGRAIAHLICENSLGEIECYDKACEYRLPKEYETAPENIEAVLTASCTEINCEKRRGEAQAELTITVSGVIIQKSKTAVLQEINCLDEIAADDSIALRIYYAQQGEEVFDIAKRYHASPASIAALAQIDSDVLTTARRLLIPASE